MAYQNVLTPRIYLNVPEFIANSEGSYLAPRFRMLPVVPSPISGATQPLPSSGAITNTSGGNVISYIAVLGHNSTAIQYSNYEAGIINGDYNNCSMGFSIVRLSGFPSTLQFNSGNKVGSILSGIFYDFPNAPDLNLTLSYEYDGIKETTTKGGHTITNAFYTGVPAWGDLGAWEIGGNPAYAKSGRRLWDISFSYLADSDIFPDNAGFSNFGDTTLETLLEDNTLQRCIHLTRGGQIPFIFQADNSVDGSDSPKVDQLAICKFDMNSFKFQQVANGVYNVKLKIKEVW